VLVNLFKQRGLLPILVALLYVSGAVFFAVVSTDSASVSDIFSAHWAVGGLTAHFDWLIGLSITLLATSTLLTRLRSRDSRTGLGSVDLVMLIYAVLTISQGDVLLRPDVLAAQFLIIASFAMVGYSYKQEGVLLNLLHAGMLLGFSSIFVGQSVLMFLALYFGLLILRSGNWREWVVPVLGALQVLVFLFLFLIWREDPWFEFEHVVKSAWVDSFETQPFSSGQWLTVGFVGLSLPSVFGRLNSGSVSDRNFLLLITGWLAAGVLSAALLGLGWQHAIVLAAFPLSVFIARLLEEMKRWWLADLLLLLLLAAPFLSSQWPL